MNLAPIWGSLVISIACPLLGGLPLIDWIAYAVTGRQLTKLGTGNVSVSAAFYHGGKLAGILAILSEAGKGIVAVLLARAFFPPGSAWEIIAIIALVFGRYWLGKGAGTTNAVWGIVTHDAIAAGLVLLISGVGFTIIRNRQLGKLGALVLLAIIIGLRHPSQPEYALAAIALSSLLAWIYRQIPDDLELSASTSSPETQEMFRFFQGDRTIISLDNKLDARQVGRKAATLSLLKRMGYSVPDGWVLKAGEEHKSLLATLQPSTDNPLVVRSSAIGEDESAASAAGQYLSVLNVTSIPALQAAITDCQASYQESTAIAYRQQSQSKEGAMSVLIQKQIDGIFSGVAFSRDPVDRINDAVAIEALAGNASQVVSGKFNPQRYRVSVPSASSLTESISIIPENHLKNSTVIARDVIESVALLAREMEDLFDGIPQDLEWTYDGEKLWLLQVRPITTLQPIWTRRIAAEVIPGKIRPLTWSINQPLTCGVWGKLFTIVLGKKARDLNFNQTATLHFASAYFNVTLLGQIFRRMGLPPESLEFLTRGEKFTKPPLKSTIQNIPGLWRLLKREWELERTFAGDANQLFAPMLSAWEATSAEELSSSEILTRIQTILELLNKATYYNILAPLSLSLRQSMLRVADSELDRSQTVEIQAVKALANVASETRKLLGAEQITMDSSASLFAHIAENPEGGNIMEQFDSWLDTYGYMSEVATDIAVPRWRDNPAVPRDMFARFFFDLQQRRKTQLSPSNPPRSWQAKTVQNRLNLKDRVATIYNKLLAHLRWSFLALEAQWLRGGILQSPGDIFFLNFAEIEELESNGEIASERLPQLIARRQDRWQRDRALTRLPQTIYGNPEPHNLQPTTVTYQTKLAGIGASPGAIEGSIKIVSALHQIEQIDRQTIVVVPYTDAGWSPILARAGGLISEVGGRLSHGAIVAREYHIPAVMDVPDATHLLKDGQRVRIDGQTGIVEILE
jgi:phosphohistidine swiveling domain-containing protein/glycerol-3-phosphate acyltransferase PlsY